MSVFDMAIYVAITTFVVGWLVVILDTITGFGLIDRIPSKVIDAYGAIHKGAFIGVAVILLSGFIWRFANI